jgi:NADPH2:quinone reductase
MRAIQMSTAGGIEVLQPAEVAEPKISRETHLKVRLKAAGVNPIDTKLRSRGLFFPDALPAILGCDGAGIVEELGPAVSRFQPGDEVWFCNGGLGGEQGNYAEFTLVDESVAQPKPASLSFAEAAAAPLVLITAWESLFDRARLKAGQTVLIHAGAGGVGHVAIQLAKHAGARVCTTVGSGEKAEFVHFLGADETIRGVDIVLDTVGGETFRQSIEAVAHYGDLVTLLDPGTDVVWKEARNRNLRIGFDLMLTPLLHDLPEARAHHGEILRRCGELCDKGELKIHVSHALPLAQAGEAHRMIEEGHMQGKVALTL